MWTPTTKAERLQARESILDAARQDGATVTVHPDADCISVLEHGHHCTTLRIYHGSAVTPAENVCYRSPERAQEMLARHLDSRRKRVAAKAADRAAGKPLTDAAQTAAAIRKMLAGIFPGVKFGVTSSTYSMGDSVTIRWTDGPVSALVDYYVGQYETGTFDSMTDCAGYRDIDPALQCPGARHISTARTMSEALREQIIASMHARYGDDIPDCYRHGATPNAYYYEHTHPDTWPQVYQEMHAMQQAERAAQQEAAAQSARHIEAQQAAEASKILAYPASNGAQDAASSAVDMIAECILHKLLGTTPRNKEAQIIDFAAYRTKCGR